MGFAISDAIDDLIDSLLRFGPEKPKHRIPKATPKAIPYYSVGPDACLPHVTPKTTYQPSPRRAEAFPPGHEFHTWHVRAR